MSAVDEVQTVVVGAGVVGLAVARALALTGREVLLLERNDAFGTETSSRNSEVIHAGIHHAPGSLKAELCVSGRRMLYTYCAEHSVPHARIGKLIVATQDGQRDQLTRIRDHAAANGVDDLRLLDPGEMTQMEPDLVGAAGLLSPSTGIVDSHAFMRSLSRDATAAGAAMALRSPVVGGEVSDGRLIVRVGDDGDSDIGGGAVACRELVNSAGLQAWQIARSLSGFPAARIPAAYLAKGSYFTLSSGRAPFSRLIYPVPTDGGLGVHLTLDMAGQARFGPDVEWLDTDAVEFAVDPARGDRFYAEIRRYWPGLEDDSLTAAYAGVRPKLSGAGDPAADFVIDGPADHGVPGMVNLFGIESPGLTSSLAIAEYVTAVLTR